MEPATTLRPALLGKPIASYRAMPLPPATWMLWVALWATLLTASLFNDHLNLQFFYWMALLGTAATCWTARRRMRSRLDLYQNGFDLRQGKRHRRVCWNQIYEVYQVPIYGCLTRVDGQAVPASWIVHIIRRDGRCLRLAGFEAMQRLGSHIQHSLSERQLRVAVDAYRAGYTVRFGRHFAVGHDGIYVRHQRMAWDDIAEISIDDADSIRLTPQQITTDSLHIESSLVPNLPVLHEFLQMTQQPDFHGHAAESIEDAEWDPHETHYHRDAEDGPAEADETQLLLAGFDWEDLGELRAGNLTVEELVARGPRNRPRQPR